MGREMPIRAASGMARAHREDFYDDERQGRSVVTILAVVAGGLAVAVVVMVVLYAAGFFNRSAPSTTITATAATTPVGAPQSLTPAQFPAATTDVTPTVAAHPADPEPPVHSTHGDWQIRCDTPAGASSEQCVLMQFVTAEDRDNVGLTV